MKKKFYSLLLLIAVSALVSCSSSDTGNINTDDPEKAYFAAKSNYDKGDYLEAIDDFNLIKLKFSGTSIIDKSIYFLGMSYYKREEYILAIYEFETLVKNYPSSEYSENARFNMAMSYYKLSPAYNLDQTYSRYAITEFQNFLDLYPDSKHARSADKRIAELKNKLAYKTYKSAELYYNLENYKAALVYYNNILEEYFDSKYADDALYGKIQVLIIKKMFEEAKKEIKRFEEIFTSSEFLSRVKTLKTRIPA
ncbi:MAG TPA: outer membrane protein assembly factor BamD [Ignavibacteria bacterium]|nr:outer membrane protein assembly factor BamD [Ignavibacteria bacterium]HRK00518.1 outer membrane protein assembly factor BamD [Ignavibacteria bacterium]